MKITPEQRASLYNKLKEGCQWWDEAAGIGAVPSSDCLPVMIDVLQALATEWQAELQRRIDQGEP